mmetsp:Transcript_2466/g.5210  ORF Transcript_2466/g.5210 Transcript_2466/m.5210 type:complete len:288 (+) Transcript_2466:44-907(+)
MKYKMILTTVGPSLVLLLGLLLASAANSVDAFSSHVACRSAARSPTALLVAIGSHRSRPTTCTACSCSGEETAPTCTSITSIDRRSAISGAAAATVLTLVGFVPAAQAGIDPNALKALPTEGDTSGAASRLKQIEALKTNPVTTDAPFEQLPSGVSYGDFREGKGDAIVQAGSKVAVEMTIRCKSFATANDPGGVKYFSTKDDTDFNEVGFTVGSGEILPGLEEGMMGMKKGGIRRIEVPSTMVFAAKKEGQLPLPSEKNKDGKRRFEQLFKTDATLLFEVLVTRIK